MAQDRRGDQQGRRRRPRRQRGRERRLRRRQRHRRTSSTGSTPQLGAGTYAYIDVDAETGQINALGTDAIKVGMLYKPADGHAGRRSTAALNTQEFVNGGDTAPRSRPSLAQAFEVNATGGVFVADVNHLKSKGSACTVPDAGDGQGNCNASRTVSAKALADLAGRRPDRAPVRSDVAHPRRPQLLRQGGPDPRPRGRPGSPTSCESLPRRGRLLLRLRRPVGLPRPRPRASPVIVSQVTGVAEYHINADEPSVLDYNTDFKTPEPPGRASTRRTSSGSPTTTRCIVGLRRTAAVVDGGVRRRPRCRAATATRASPSTSRDRDAGDTHAVTVDVG